MNYFNSSCFFLIFFLLFLTSCATTLKENKIEKRKVDTQISQPSSESNYTKKHQTPANNLSSTQIELEEALKKKQAIQERLTSLGITNGNDEIIETTYGSRIIELNNKRYQLLVRYTNNHPEVKSIERQIKQLEAQHSVKIEPTLQSSETTVNDLKQNLSKLNRTIGYLSIHLLENQKRYNDLHKPNYIPGVKDHKFEHPGGLHSGTQISIARKKIAMHEQPWELAFATLTQQANKGLGKSPEAVIDFNVPGYYKDAKGHSKASRRLRHDAWVAYLCALVYQLSPDKNRVQYAEKTVQILDAWATTNKKTSNFDGDLTMMTVGSGLVLAAELLTDYNGWKKEQRKNFKKWLSTVFLQSCKKISIKSNNWGDWGIFGCMASHYFLDDIHSLDNDINSLVKKIDNTILTNGSMPLETKRGKRGLWYTYFALAPLTSASQIALNARNLDLFQFKGMDGAGIEEALDYLLRYSIKPKKWPHYKGKDLVLPRPKRWPGNLFDAMYGIYNKQEYKSWTKDNSPGNYFVYHTIWMVPTLLRTVPPRHYEYE